MTMTIWTLRATIGQEKAIAKHISKKIENKKIGVFSLLVPESLRGYIFIESDAIENIDQAISGIPHVRSKVVGEVEIAELEGFLVPKPTIEGLHINDIIEIISGPFKGSRAKINRIDISREEITVELLDSDDDFSTEADGKDAKSKDETDEKEEEDVFSEFFKST
ncbi:MAG: transcription elongation factor Spt5 [Candidatus Heimdallarchaeota archaeon]